MLAHHFEINVSRDGRHFFATHERSLNLTSKLEDALIELRNRFPESEGFQITVSAQIEYGHRFENSAALAQALHLYHDQKTHDYLRHLELPEIYQLCVDGKLPLVTGQIDEDNNLDFSDAKSRFKRASWANGLQDRIRESLKKLDAIASDEKAIESARFLDNDDFVKLGYVLNHLVQLRNKIEDRKEF